MIVRFALWVLRWNGIYVVWPPVEPFQVETPSPWARYDAAKDAPDGS
jgi:hypothetical protein